MSKRLKKEWVRRTYPTAGCWRARDTGRYLVTEGVSPYRRLGIGCNAKTAWADAARGLMAVRDGRGSQVRES